LEIVGTSRLRVSDNIRRDEANDKVAAEALKRKTAGLKAARRGQCKTGMCEAR
jgi:hypothetical protein